MVSGFVFRHLFETEPQAIYPPFVETHFVNTKFFGIEHRMIYPKIQGGVRFCIAFYNWNMLHWTHPQGELLFFTIKARQKVWLLSFILIPGAIVPGPILVPIAHFGPIGVLAHFSGQNTSIRALFAKILQERSFSSKRAFLTLQR